MAPGVAPNFPKWHPKRFKTGFLKQYTINVLCSQNHITDLKRFFLHKTPLILDQFSHFIPQKTNDERVYKIFHNRTLVWGVGQIPV